VNFSFTDGTTNDTSGGASWSASTSAAYVMDGQFVPNISMGPVVIEALRRACSLPLDVHMMIVQPEAMIPSIAAAGATHITVHYEATPDLYRTVNLIKRHGCKAGVALNPHTPASVLSEILPILDEIIVMTVSPGFGGQALIPQVLGKITQLRAMVNEKQLEDFPILVDGGVNLQTIAAIAQAGGNVFAVGSSVFSDRFSVAEGIAALQETLRKAKED
jgi:ribulose-phosphate 3-epimerase